MNDPTEPTEHVTVVEALTFKLCQSMNNTGLPRGHANILAEDVTRLVRALIQEAIPIGTSDVVPVDPWAFTRLAVPRSVEVGDVVDWSGLQLLPVGSRALVHERPWPRDRAPAHPGQADATWTKIETNGPPGPCAREGSTWVSSTASALPDLNDLRAKVLRVGLEVAPVAPALPTVELVDAVRGLCNAEWGTGNGLATVNADAFLAVRQALIERDRRVSPVLQPAPAPALPTVELVDAVRALCMFERRTEVLPGYVVVKADLFQAARYALAERDRRASPYLPPPPVEPFTIGIRRRLDETIEAQGRRLEELTTQLREQAECLDERQAQIDDLERNLGRVEAERQGLVDQLARPPSVRAMEQALLRDLSRADLPCGHYVPRYGPNAQDNMVRSDGHVILATGDGEQGSDILYLSIYPAARDVAGRSMEQSAKLSAVARLLWNASRIVNERTR